ncbi:MAG: CoA transferase, partial [Proteobacteria bacterium]|nr:CoA transferase [Pseudomonadota bacterium]
GMLDCQLALLENAIMRYFVSGTPPGPLGARHPTITPFEVFATADQPLIIAAGNDALYVKLCEALGRQELATDPRFATNDLRNGNVDALKAALEASLRRQPAAHWMSLFDAAGIPAGPINNVAQAVALPQAAARNMLVTVDDPQAGRMKLVGNPIKVSGFADPKTRAPAPDLDADRARILAEVKLQAEATP